MTTISVSFPDEVMKRLEEEASGRNKSREDLTIQSVMEMLAKSRSENGPLVAEIIEENKELYRRLAG